MGNALKYFCSKRPVIESFNVYQALTRSKHVLEKKTYSITAVRIGQSVRQGIRGWRINFACTPALPPPLQTHCTVTVGGNSTDWSVRGVKKMTILSLNSIYLLVFVMDTLWVPWAESLNVVYRNLSRKWLLAITSHAACRAHCVLTCVGSVSEYNYYFLKQYKISFFLCGHRSYTIRTYPPNNWIWPSKAYTGLFISPSGISELDCATTKTDTAERSISIGWESLQVFFCTRGLGVLPGSTARG